jgi:hypothetical protein
MGGDHGSSRILGNSEGEFGGGFGGGGLGLLGLGGLGGFGGGGGAEEALGGGAGGVEGEEAIDELVFEGFAGFPVGVGDGVGVGGDGDVGPAVGGEDGAIELEMEGAQGDDGGVVDVRVLQQVVRGGQPLIGRLHEGGPGVVQRAAGLVEGAAGHQRLRWRQREGFEAVGRTVALSRLER